MITFDRVTRKFGEHTIALDSISLQIADGEFVFLVGTSGAGKTTLLRLITRDLLPSSGHIHVDSWDVVQLTNKQIPLLRRKVAMIFQDFKVLSDRTVYENVAIALEILGKKEKEIETSVVSTLEVVGLGGKISVFPAQLSAGELQRVSIARAIVGKPGILLADEPTGNLDPKTGWDIIKLLVDINKRNTTIIMATHNMDIVNSMRRRVVSMKHGKVTRDEKIGKYQ